MFVDGGIQVLDVGGVMLVVMQLHGFRVDVGLQCIELVRQRWKVMSHLFTSVILVDSSIHVWSKRGARERGQLDRGRLHWMSRRRHYIDTLRAAPGLATRRLPCAHASDR